MSEEETGKIEYRNLLAPVKAPDDANRITELVSLLVGDARIVYLTVVRNRGFREMQEDWRKSTEVLETYRKRTVGRRAQIIPKIRYSDSVHEGVLDQAEEEDSDLIILGWSKQVSLWSLGRTTPIDEIFYRSDRDVLVFHDKSEGIRDIKRILFPVGYKDYDYSKRLSVVAQLMDKLDATCVLTHVNTGNKTDEEVEEIFEGPRAFMEELGVDVETEVIESKSISRTLIKTSEDFDLIVLGPSRTYAFSRYLFGSRTDKIVENSKCSSLIFKQGEKKWKAWAVGMVEGIKNGLKKIFFRNPGASSF